jgi:hypothetical protein
MPFDAQNFLPGEQQSYAGNGCLRRACQEKRTRILCSLFLLKCQKR